MRYVTILLLVFGMSCYGNCPDLNRLKITWGVNNQDINIEEGEVISDVRLETDGYCYIFIIDNPDTEIEIVSEEREEIDHNNCKYGTRLREECFQPNERVYLSQHNDPNNHVWDVFEQPLNINGINFSSSLLKAIDYAGTGRSLGLLIFGNFRKAQMEFIISDLATGEEVNVQKFGIDLFDSFFQNWLQDQNGLQGKIEFPDINRDNKVDMKDWGIFSAKYYSSGLELGEYVVASSGYNDLSTFAEYYSDTSLANIANIISNTWMKDNL